MVNRKMIILLVQQKVLTHLKCNKCRHCEPGEAQRAEAGVAIQETRLRVDELRPAGHNPAQPLGEDGLDRAVAAHLAMTAFTILPAAPPSNH